MNSDNIPNSAPAQPPADAQAEAVRMGLEDSSAAAGATVDDSAVMAAGAPTTAADPDAMNEQAKVVGEEAVGGTTPTPDQSVVDDVGDAAGISFEPDQPVAVKAEMDQRDDQRWELDPNSAGR